MTPALRLLDEVSWRGSPLAGERLGALLAALALSPSGVSDAGLVDVVWDDDRPANPHKALQVLVSRVRSQCGSTVVSRQANGYRLGVGTDEVDALLLESLVAQAGERLGAADPEKAAELAGQALALAPTGQHELGGEGPLAQLRTKAWLAVEEAQRLGGLALTRCGREREALDLLIAANARGNTSPELIEALLRAEAAVKGVPAALERYESFRSELRERLGVDPDDSLQRVFRELLTADDPVRTGIRYDAEELLGREAELTRLRGSLRSSRLTSIIGPGGIGKTRIAHVLAREATQSRVHFIELVGITSPDDVVAEVGAALGVRDSVTSRRTHTPAQRANIRGRIAQELEAGPALLVLDNCEHVVESVASLVAFLLVTVRDLRVVTTSRAPLNIGAEQVVLLDQLSASDGAALFVRRARAARPTAELDPGLVDDVVSRLDGLPLAIELAAARVRTMSLEELRKRLADRFAVLRGKDRTAPARHQTLTAVIEWSWDLLGRDEQRALAWLSAFHDGVGIGSAEAVLGPDAMDLVEALVDQSLLSVTERDGAVRYRMLETVREFGTIRLAEAGDTARVLAAQTAWAVTMTERLRPEMFGQGQVAAVDELSHEENNLADVLRRAIGEDDPAVAVRLIATLGMFWAITGNNPRIFSVVDAAERMMERWEPPSELVQATQEALALMVSHMGYFQDRTMDALVAALVRLGKPDQPWARATYAMFAEADAGSDRIEAVLTVAEDPEPATALMALQWAATLAENQGDLEAARAYTERALAMADERTTPWQRAMLHTQLSLLAQQFGDPHTGAEHAELAWPLLVRLHAHDDAVQVRAGMALGALQLGDLAKCERLLEDVRRMRQGSSVSGVMVESATRAELALAKGEESAGLSFYFDAVGEMGAVWFPGMEASGMEPWTLVAEAAALAAHVHHARTPLELSRRDGLAASLQDKGVRIMRYQNDGFIDFPVTGMLLAALGGWALDRDAVDPEIGVRLLVMAHRFSYNRSFPVMAWRPFEQAAERALPGRLAELQEEYDGRLGRELIGEVVELLTTLAQISD